MALLDSGLASVDEKGILRLVNTPFQGEVPKPQNVDAGCKWPSLSSRHLINTAQHTRKICLAF